MPDESPKLVLHNNADDPYQMKNIADEEPEMVRRLMAEMDLWLDKTKDPWLG